MSQSKKKKSKKKREAKGPEAPVEVDGRSAARALKKALEESDAKEKEKSKRKRKSTESAKSAESAEAPSRRRAKRRKRPPTSIGAIQPRPKPPELPAKKEPVAPGHERPAFHRRHDVAVVLVALLLLATGAILSRSLAETTPRRFDRMGLSFNRPALFLPPQRVEPAIGDPAADGTELPYHIIYQSPIDPLLRLEVTIDHRPQFNNLRAARALDRASSYGDMVWLKDSEDIKISGRLWLRSEYRYAFKAGDFDSPKVATAVESATLNGALLYVVTFHGGEQAAAELAHSVTPTLAVDPDHPAAATIKE